MAMNGPCVEIRAGLMDPEGDTIETKRYNKKWGLTYKEMDWWRQNRDRMEEISKRSHCTEILARGIYPIMDGHRLKKKYLIIKTMLSVIWNTMCIIQNLLISILDHVVWVVMSSSGISPGMDCWWVVSLTGL